MSAPTCVLMVWCLCNGSHSCKLWPVRVLLRLVPFSTFLEEVAHFIGVLRGVQCMAVVTQ